MKYAKLEIEQKSRKGKGGEIRVRSQKTEVNPPLADENS
jgi:hypothetical protein